MYKDTLTLEQIVEDYLEQVIFSITTEVQELKRFRQLQKFNYTLNCTDKEFIEIVTKIKEDKKFERFYHNTSRKELLFDIKYFKKELI